VVAPGAADPTTVGDMAKPVPGPIRIGPKGRVVLPIEARRELGFEEGDELLVLVEDDMIKLMTRERLLKLLQEEFADYPGSLVEDLLAERRAAARREREEIERYVAGWPEDGSVGL
jgi:AbrB family transcriptional regulator, stage V sporulation protein T